MNPDALSKWLTEYGQAWIMQDSMRTSALFTDDAIYQETPFNDPLRGRPAIRTYWENVTADQSNIDFAYEVLSETPNMGIAQWWASYTIESTRETVKLDGIAVIGLNSQNLCTSFHEWWHKLAMPAE